MIPCRRAIKAGRVLIVGFTLLLTGALSVPGKTPLREFGINITYIGKNNTNASRIHALYLREKLDRIYGGDVYVSSIIKVGGQKFYEISPHRPVQFLHILSWNRPSESLLVYEDRGGKLQRINLYPLPYGLAGKELALEAKSPALKAFNNLIKEMFPSSPPSYKSVAVMLAILTFHNDSMEYPDMIEFEHAVKGDEKRLGSHGSQKMVSFSYNDDLRGDVRFEITFGQAREVEAVKVQFSR